MLPMILDICLVLQVVVEMLVVLVVFVEMIQNLPLTKIKELGLLLLQTEFQKVIILMSIM